MKRLNQYQFYKMGTSLHPLSTLEEGISVAPIAWQLDAARDWLNFLLQPPLNLIVCKASIENLLEVINDIIPTDVSEFSKIPEDRKLLGFENYFISRGLAEFETVLANELATIDTYVVAKKGIYSTADLVERAELALDESARDNIRPEILEDFKQAGKCLAFELPTAAGFHTTRAVEGVLRDYWTLVKKPKAGKKTPEMAVCINELRAEGENPKLMDILDHIRDLHRNTIMHPEAFLTIIESLRLFDISKSAISAMADRIGELKPPPPIEILSEVLPIAEPEGV